MEGRKGRGGEGKGEEVKEAKGKGEGGYLRFRDWFQDPTGDGNRNGCGSE